MREGSRTVLVVEDDPPMQRYLLKFFSDRGYRSILVPTLAETADVLEGNDFELTVVDTAADRDAALEAAASLKSMPGDAGTIVALRAASGGPDDLVPPPGIDHVVRKSTLDTDLDRVIEALTGGSAPPESEPVPMNDAPPATTPALREMALWQSKRMREVRQIIVEAAAVDVTVLITGETGTGKDVVARAIHALSSRRSGPYVKVNCAAVPADLLESELFGHERGAFTGAHKLKIGKFEAAHNGTIFLDEIGDLHPALQAKLLHVLQDGDVSRVGGKSTFKVNTRVLAATNQDLERGVIEGRFREDLYYRLNVIQIAVPPLRERLEEVPGLVEYFVEKYCTLFRRPRVTIPPAVMEQLLQQRYRGNVRELENVIKRMIILGDSRLGGGLTSALTQTPPAEKRPVISLKDVVRRAALAAERDAIRKVLEQNGWNRARTARALNISYRGLLYKIKRVGLRDEAIPQRPVVSFGREELDGSLS
jgi:two-component system response regulator AtoC